MAPQTDDVVGRPGIGVQPCPGHRVVAICDLPSGTHDKSVVHPGCPGEIVRTPAYFSTTYSIRFRVNDREVTLHRVNRHEFRLVGQESTPVPPGFPPASRYPQPRPVPVAPRAGDDAPAAPPPGTEAV
jgi:hypothetical protein